MAFRSLSNFLPDYYAIVFWIIFISSIFLAFLMEFFQLNRPILNNAISRRYVMLFLGVVVAAISLVFLTTRVIHLSASSSTLYSSGDGFSWGEEFLMPESPDCKNKTSGKVAFEGGDYGSAERYYRDYASSESCRNYPEARIYFNNAHAMKTSNPMRIAVSVPITRKDGDRDSAELLRGIAIAQEQWNSDDKNRQLLVGIVDDGHGMNGEGECGERRDEGECKKALEVAESLVKKPDLLGIIGHFSSDATEAAAPVYKRGELVIISPTSTAIRSNLESCKADSDAICLNSYVFRTAPRDSIAVRKLISELPTTISKVAVIYESESKYSRLFKKVFQERFGKKQETDAVVNQQSEDNPCNFSRSRGFGKGEECLAEAKNKQANALLLIPSTKNANSVVDDFLKQNSSSAPALRLLGSDSMYKERFITDPNKQRTQNMLVVVPWYRNNEPCSDDSERLECKAKKLFGYSEISWRTATAYDATQILLQGLKKTADEKCSVKVLALKIFDRGASCTRKELNNVLINSNVEAVGVLGNRKVKFDEDGDREDDGQLGVVVEVRDREYRKFLG
ncbi:ABC transporter substrate-binding protein [Phormidesmis sp. 146-20]